MKYHSVIVAGALAFSGVTGAADDSSPSKEELVDYRVECIEAAIADELPGDQADAFVQNCVAQMVAKRKTANKGA